MSKRNKKIKKKRRRREEVGDLYVPTDESEIKRRKRPKEAKPRQAKRLAKRKANKPEVDEILNEPLQDVLDRLGIRNWDYLLVGDGSGSQWERGAGWGCVLIERQTGERHIFTGAVNYGTVNFAEMMAYLQPLEWLACREVNKRNKSQIGVRALRIHILTDSEYCRNTGNSKGRMMAKNAGFWSVFDVFARHGFVLTWHWIRRMSVGLNRYSDDLSRVARITFQDYNPVERVSKSDTVSEINPIDISD